MADTFAIETTELRKRYREVDALQGLNLQVPTGSICGFLGRNGAGKTTTIKLLLGMARPTDGVARVLGHDAASVRDSVAIRRRTAFVSDDKELYGYMTVEQMIRFTAAFFPAWRSDLEERYLRKFELPRHRRVKALSQGTRTKLALLLALCRNAELLILDEPTSGLDPAMTEEVLQLLVSHASESTTIFFSSHQVAEVDQISDRVVILHRGRAVVAGALDDLRERYRRIHLVFDTDAPLPTFRSRDVRRVSRKGRMLTVLTTGNVDDVLTEIRALAPVSVNVAPVPLKEIFLEAATED